MAISKLDLFDYVNIAFSDAKTKFLCINKNNNKFQILLIIINQTKTLCKQMLQKNFLYQFYNSMKIK